MDQVHCSRQQTGICPDYLTNQLYLELPCPLLLQDSYLLSARCALEEHPTHKPPLSLLQTLHTKASAALRAATQLPIDPEGLKTLRRTLCQLVRPVFV